MMVHDPTQPFDVLFLCTGNSARSILAEALLNRAGQGKFKAYSAGSTPKGEVHPYTLDLLRRMNFDVSEARSKSWNEFAQGGAPKLDFVFTVCDNAANETCPLWPGQPMTAHWGIPDPAAAEGTEPEVRLAFAEVFRQLSNRINIFVALPMRSLDTLSLQQQLDAIGKTKGTQPPHTRAAE
jgi:arsenate reductase (thioredoxin)